MEFEAMHESSLQNNWNWGVGTKTSTELPFSNPWKKSANHLGLTNKSKVHHEVQDLLSKDPMSLHL